MTPQPQKHLWGAPFPSVVAASATPGVRLAARALNFSPRLRKLVRLVTRGGVGSGEAQALRRAAASPRHKPQEEKWGFLDFAVCGDG
jgi:hypothetical protein